MAQAIDSYITSRFPNFSNEAHRARREASLPPSPHA